MTLRGAILGFGKVAEKAHAPAFLARASEFSIDAIAEPGAERRAAAAALFPGARLYASPEELLQRETRLDFVDIATPPHLHAKLALQGLQRRMNVLCEKPLSLNFKDFESLKAQAAGQGRSVFTVHNWKQAPIFAKAAEILGSKALGEIRHAELHVLRDKPAASADGDWRTNPSLAGGGILVDHGWHAFYLLTSLLRQEPRMVTCRLQIPPQTGAEEEAALLIELATASAVVFLTWRAGHRSNWALFVGSRGTLELRDDRLELRLAGGASETFEFAEKLSAGSAHAEWFQAMLDPFRAEIEDPRQRGQNLKEAEACLQLLSHAYQSHRLGGKSVPLPVPAGKLLVS